MRSDHDGHHEQPVVRPSPDLAYLHPDNLRIGSIGVFAGDWACTGRPPRIPVGFVGVLIDHWNGLAVWRCTREVPRPWPPTSSGCATSNEPAWPKRV